METKIGGARLDWQGGRRIGREVLRQVNDALRRQTEAYLTESPMLRHDGAQALHRMRPPVLTAVGIDSVAGTKLAFANSC